MNILHAGQTARCNDGYRHGARQLCRRRNIHAHQQAVAVYVGVNQCRNARIFKAFGKLDGRQIAFFSPALNGHEARARINADRNAARKRAAPFVNKLRVAQSRRAQYDAVNALLQPGFNGRQIANAAAQLREGGAGLDRRLDRRHIDRRTGKRPVQVDNMQMPEALRGKGACLVGRVIVENRRARHIALLKAHAPAFFQINGGENNHGFQFTKFSMSRNPAVWLFSG